MNNKDLNTTKRKKVNVSGIVALVIAGLVLVIAVPINIIASYFNKNIDMTPADLYTLTDTTKSLLESVKDKQIEFTLLCDIEDLKDFNEYLPLYNTIQQYASYDNIKFEDYYAEDYPDRVEKLNPDGALNLGVGDIIIKCGNAVRKIEADSTILDSYDATGTIIVESRYVAENLISGAIKTVTEGDLQDIYFLTGHGEKTIEKDYTKFAANLKNYNYTTKSLNLMDTKAVPDDAAIIFIASPQEDITFAEKKLLLEYAENGGNLVFLMSPNDEPFRYSNIEDILYQYNIAMDYNRVYETNPDAMYTAKDPYTFFVNLPVYDGEKDVDLTTELNEVVGSGLYPFMLASRSFYTVSGDNSKYLEVSSLIQTAALDSNYTAKSESFGGTELDPNEPYGCLDLAYYSYNKRTNSKLIVMGNGEYMDDEHSSDIINSIPIYLTQASITWMYDNDVDMGIPPKITSFDMMRFTSSSEAERTMNIFVIAPILVALVGVGVWLKRRNA